MSRYTCYKCKAEHGEDNMVAYCACCFSAESRPSPSEEALRGSEYFCGLHKSAACKPCSDEAWTESSELMGEVYAQGLRIKALEAVVEAGDSLASWAMCAREDRRIESDSELMTAQTLAWTVELLRRAEAQRDAAAALAALSSSAPVSEAKP